MRVVIDPNVLLSALIAPGGASDQAVRRIVVHGTPIASQELLDRFVQRAREERFRRWFSVADAEELAGQLAELAEVAEDAAHVPAVVVADPSDDYLVALAAAAAQTVCSLAIGASTAPLRMPTTCVLSRPRTCSASSQLTPTAGPKTHEGRAADTGVVSPIRKGSLLSAGGAETGATAVQSPQEILSSSSLAG